MNIKCNGGGDGGDSEGEDGFIFQSPLNGNNTSSRKRIKLQGKVSVNRCPVDHALVPRRVRSAMKNRVNQSTSPPLSDSKRQQHASIGTQLFKGSSKQRTLEEVTKDEEEVAEALTCMANFISCKPVKKKEDGRISEDNPEKKATLAAHLAAPEEEGTKLLVPSNGTKASDPWPCVEDSPKVVKTDPSTSPQPVATSVSQKFEIEANGASLLKPLRNISSNMEQMESIADFRDATSLSNHLVAPQHFPVNGTMLPTQLDSCLVQSKEMNLWPLGTASLNRELVMHDREKAPFLQPGSHSRIHDQLKMPSSSKAAAYTNCVDVSGRHRANGLLAEKLPLTSADQKRPSGRCITHVNISQLIQNHQKAEKNQLPTPQFNQLKAKEAANHSIPTSGETSRSRNGMVPQLANGSLVERNMLEARNRMLQDGGRLLQAQQAAALSGAYAQQKQGRDFLSLSALGDTKSSGNRVKSSGQLLVPYPPSHGVMPITFPRGPYTSQFQEQVAAGATQQVQLQLPAYTSNSQLYGQHMGQATTQQQQQQLMWQGHLAYYRPPVNFQPKWQQNGRRHESSSSSSSTSLVQNPPSIFPLPADYNPHNLHQSFVMPMPSSSSLPSRSKQKQQHNGSGLNPQSSSQLQMICNAESFR